MHNPQRRCGGFSLAVHGVIFAVIAACAPTPPTPAAGVPDAAFPPLVARFARVGDLVRGKIGVTAGYQLTDADVGVEATVHVAVAVTGASLLPSLDRRDGKPADIAAAALARSIAQVRRFYPRGRVEPPHDAFVVRGGALRPGRASTLHYEELLDGRLQLFDLDVVVFCCADGDATYEYRFRHPASVDAHAADAAFIEPLPWPPLHP